jgi:hypothetical protein
MADGTGGGSATGPTGDTAVAVVGLSAVGVDDGNSNGGGRVSGRASLVTIS